MRESRVRKKWLSQRVAAVVLLGTIGLFPCAAIASDATAPSEPNASTLATSDTPDSFKQWVATQKANEPAKRRVAIALIVLITAAGGTASYLMTLRRAEADLMLGNSHNRWIRDRNGGTWNQWERK